MKDFFISYTAVDKDWAVWIAWILEEAGYQVFVQAWDILPGNNFVAEMQKAMIEYRQTIAVLSENYFDSKYTKAEWTAAITHDPTGESRSLIPVKVRECTPEGFFLSTAYVDIVGCSEQDARAALLSAFSARLKPTVAPMFPSDRRHRNTHTKTTALFPGNPTGVTRNTTEQILDISSNTLSSGSTASATRSLPPKNLLAKKCDRYVQNQQLDFALNKHLSNRPSRPLIYIVHGDERECHTEFLDRTREENISQLIQNYDNDTKRPICLHYEIHVKWKNYKKVSIPKMIQQQLSAVTSRSGSPYEQILSLSPARCVLITFLVYSEDSPHGWQIDRLLKYWAEFEDLPPQLLLIINLNFRYRCGEGFRVRWKNHKLRTNVRQLHNREVPTVSLVGLEELLPVEQRDAVQLVKDNLVQRFYDLDVSDVETLYSMPKLRVEMGTMHMAELTHKLLEFHHRRRGYLR